MFLRYTILLGHGKYPYTLGSATGLDLNRTALGFICRTKCPAIPASMSRGVFHLSSSGLAHLPCVLSGKCGGPVVSEPYGGLARDNLPAAVAAGNVHVARITAHSVIYCAP